MLNQLTLSLFCSLLIPFGGLASQEVLHFEPVLNCEQILEQHINRTVFAACTPTEPNRLYLARFSGDVNVLETQANQVRQEAFLVVEDLSIGIQTGLFSMAFHPDYRNNGRLFVCYADSDANYVIEEYQRKNENRAEAVHRTLVIQQTSTDSFHTDYGGWIGFGNDNYLYASVGGGLVNSKEVNFAGTVLRIDIDGDDFPDSKDRNYAIPETNPMIGVAGFEEIIAKGFKNPWRCSFDRTGNLFIGNLGGIHREEVNLIPANYDELLNFGFPCFEGSLLLQDPRNCQDSPEQLLTLPILEYKHTDNKSGVIGGYCYYGKIRSLQNKYFYGDLQDPFHLESFVFDGTLNPIQFNGKNVNETTTWRHSIPVILNDSVDQFPVSFSKDCENNLFLITNYGFVYKLESIRQVGDFNGDETIDLLDVSPFVNALSAGISCDGLDNEVYQGLADINYDLKVDFDDVLPFIDLILK